VHKDAFFHNEGDIEGAIKELNKEAKEQEKLKNTDTDN